MNTFKKGDLVYLNRPDSEWVLKIDTADNQQQLFTFEDAIVRVKPISEMLKEPEHDDIDDAQFDLSTDDDLDRDQLLQMDEAEETEENMTMAGVYKWKPLIETILIDHPIRKDYFPYNFVTAYATAEQFELYMDLIGDWNSSFYLNILARRRNAPRKQATPK